VVEDILDFVEGAPGVTVFTTGLDEDLLVYDTIGSGSELLTLFRPATRRELDGREFIGVPMRFTDPEMAARTETYLHRRWEGQAVGFRNQDFIDVVPASASKGAGLRQLVASLAEPPAPETSGDAGEAGEVPAGGSVGLGVGSCSPEPMETWSIGDSWNDISMHQAADHSYALPWSPPEVVAQCDGTVSSLADLIDSLMGRPTI
ncbi:HAD family hydrolase, partial [Actinomyces oris]|uniref:HAD family hydrolase n=2 Tax=Actinomyces TaxID=1654 RepID=UPI0021170A94